MRYLIILFCFFITNDILAQQNYDVNLIPKNLLSYASAVVRNKEETIEVKSAANTVYRIKCVVTVLNKNGNDLARIIVWHNKTNAIKYIKGLVYNAAGIKINKFSEKDFSDVNAANDFSLFEDSRIEHYLPSVIDYPYTIEYEYETRSEQSLNFPEWRPALYYGLAIEKSSFAFICKPTFNIRYKEENLPEKASITTANELKTYHWQLNNVKAIREEPYSQSPSPLIAYVKIAPDKFSYEGLSGSFSNWNELGKWVYDNLLLNRDILSPQTINYIQELTKGISDPKQKARKIYEYMQQKTHYVSVQVGISGYQPFKASDVDKLNYGDCKALVNYMQALLKVVNINSYYCVVQAGNDKVGLLTDFASMSQGNHVILCIPFKNDTTWLECTNQKIPFGFLGSFTDDRTVLACTAQGGLLLHTPKYVVQTNLQIRKGSFLINETGALSGQIQTTFKGLQYDNRENLTSLSQTEQLKEITKVYPINNMEIQNLKFEQQKNTEPVTTEYLKLTARDYASNSANKLYFMVNPTNRQNNVPREIRNRQTNVYINEGYIDKDTITYTIPKGYHLEKIPLDINLDQPFGKYIAKLELKGDQLIYKREMQLLDGTYNKDTYQDLVDFYQKVADADNYNVTLVKDN